MKAGKQRLSASVDPALLVAAEAAAKRGEVPNVSAWVNDAMRLKLDHDRGLAALAGVIAEFEAENGEITNEEIARAVRTARSRGITVRGTPEVRSAETELASVLRCWPVQIARQARSSHKEGRAATNGFSNGLSMPISSCATRARPRGLN